ncbi:MAG: LysE family transporter, partial [Sulfitobacter sp.]
MNTDVLPALILFAFVSSVTPGPNNLMLMASGANFGFVRTVPHIVGISLGFLVLMALTGLGLVQVFELFPISYIVLKVLCVFSMIWLARKIAHAAPVEKRS